MDSPPYWPASGELREINVSTLCLVVDKIPRQINPPEKKNKAVTKFKSKKNGQTTSASEKNS